jgi:hypothetical protein
MKLALEDRRFNAFCTICKSVRYRLFVKILWISFHEKILVPGKSSDLLKKIKLSSESVLDVYCKIMY